MVNKGEIGLRARWEAESLERLCRSRGETKDDNGEFVSRDQVSVYSDQLAKIRQHSWNEMTAYNPNITPTTTTIPAIAITFFITIFLFFPLAVFLF